VFAETLRRLEGLNAREKVRWHDPLWFVLSWALRRRPAGEWDELVESARESQSEVATRVEVQGMSETIERTWEQEILARGEARGELRTRREDLRLVLEERFGKLPAELARRIDETEDPDRLRGALRQVVRLHSLADLKL
jgi:hypothetical protein